MAAKFSQNWNKWIDKVLKGTHNHYSCYLPEKLGAVVTLILRLFYSGIKTDKSQTDLLQQLQDDAVIVYATKFRSYFEYLFYYIRYQKINLPYPQIGFDYSVYLWQPLSRLVRMFVAHFDFLIRKRTHPDPYGSGYIGQALLETPTHMEVAISGRPCWKTKPAFFRW
jgi:glycerol-3-phosphate O-acyltransferase